MPEGPEIRRSADRLERALTPISTDEVRFAYTTDIANLERGVERLRRFLRAGG